MSSFNVGSAHDGVNRRLGSKVRPKAPSVFINCPFDRSYYKMRDAIVFAVMALGFEVRCALERDTATEARLEKILQIIRTCQFGVHDISFVRLDPVTRLPRYNMPFELGLFLGCCEFGTKQEDRMSCLILDRDRYRYQKSLSDLAGRDIREHKGDPKQAIREVRNWLVTESKFASRYGGMHFVNEYARFRKQLPELCRRTKQRVSDLTFPDYRDLVTQWLRLNA